MIYCNQSLERVINLDPKLLTKLPLTQNGLSPQNINYMKLYLMAKHVRREEKEYTDQMQNATFNASRHQY